ncbi:hypothetical protein A3F59_03790 [Candidatus Roizmanbacteria bacterium RIFCSPHIGHO2_12_FULL_38_13]|nr:MAG: hypothetical protein A3F59_03790 [Candidatus Roizmanbacteria bacterium RIFCSPHIGHO2_12_FULL_38_13]
MNNLNPKQQKAVKSDGVVVIIAGPGTGKTRALTARVEYLLTEKKAGPKEILALTFTKKAAAQMKERLAHLKSLPFIGTFHAFASQSIPNNNFRIIDQKEQLSILEMLMIKNKKSLTQKNLKQLLQEISLSKTNRDLHNKNEVFILYNKFLQDSNLLDFDDLLLLLYKTINTNDDFRFEHVLVDEFQDTNNLQYEIIKKLASSHLFIIGDPLQSIYTFRGADSTVFEKIKEDFTGYSKIIFETNYRSTQSIIDTSTKLFAGQTPLESAHKSSGLIQLVHTADEYTEADWIVNKINESIGGTDLLQASDFSKNKNQNLRLSDFAVIYRTHHVGRVLGQRFSQSALPYQVIGGDSPYDQKEISFIIGVLRYIYDKNKEILDSVSRSGGSDKKVIKIVSTYYDALKKLSEKQENDPLSTLIHKIMEIFNLNKKIAQSQSKQRNLQQFINNLSQFEKKKNPLKKVIDYLDYLKEHEYYDPKADKVALMTMHAAKGLEFNTVFICGFEEGLIPLLKKQNQTDLNEEKRLLYVAITRAKQDLYLFYTDSRQHKKVTISRFYELLKNKQLKKIEDAAIEKQKKRKEKWLNKKSQMELF